MQFFTRSWLPTVGLTLHDAMKLVFLISRSKSLHFVPSTPARSLGRSRRISAKKRSCIGLRSLGARSGIRIQGNLITMITSASEGSVPKPCAKV